MCRLRRRQPGSRPCKCYMYPPLKPPALPDVTCPGGCTQATRPELTVQKLVDFRLLPYLIPRRRSTSIVPEIARSTLFAVKRPHWPGNPVIFEAIEVDGKQSRRVDLDDSLGDRRERAPEVDRGFHHNELFLFGDHTLRAEEGCIE